MDAHSESVLTQTLLFKLFKYQNCFSIQRDSTHCFKNSSSSCVSGMFWFCASSNCSFNHVSIESTHCSLRVKRTLESDLCSSKISQVNLCHSTSVFKKPSLSGIIHLVQNFSSLISKKLYSKIVCWSFFLFSFFSIKSSKSKSRCNLVKIKSSGRL